MSSRLTSISPCSRRVSRDSWPAMARSDLPPESFSFVTSIERCKSSLMTSRSSHSRSVLMCSSWLACLQQKVATCNPIFPKIWEPCFSASEKLSMICTMARGFLQRPRTRRDNELLPSSKPRSLKRPERTQRPPARSSTRQNSRFLSLRQRSQF